MGFRDINREVDPSRPGTANAAVAESLGGLGEDPNAGQQALNGPPAGDSSTEVPQSENAYLGAMLPPLYERKPETVMNFECELHPYFNDDQHADIQFLVRAGSRSQRWQDYNVQGLEMPASPVGNLPPLDDIRAPRIFFAHRIILALSSAPFARVFQSSGGMIWDGRSPKEAQTIVLDQTDPDVFELLLRFLYWQNIEITTTNVLPLMDLAEKYEVMMLLEECSAFLETQCEAIDKVAEILDVAMRYKCQSVVDKCCSTILRAGNESFFGEDGGLPRYLSLGLDVFLELLRSDHWMIDEDKVFDVCEAWVHHHCPTPGAGTPSPTTVTDIFAPFLPYLRFPHMTAEKLYMIRKQGIVPDHMICDALFFKLGQCQVNWLENLGFRHRQSHIEFPSTEGFELRKDPATQRVRLRRVGAGGRCVRALRRMSTGKHEFSFKVVSNPKDIIFGVVDIEDPSLIGHENSGRMVGCHKQKRRHRGAFFARPGGEFSIGLHDTIRCVCDLSIPSGRLLYAVNDRPFEVAFEDLSNPLGENLGDHPPVTRSPNRPLSASAAQVKDWVFCLDMYTHFSHATEVEIL
jgi:hypothetical protein